MATSKHKRKTGATTVTKDGVIIGNIGSGKTTVPQPQSQTIRHDEPEPKDDTLLQKAQQKFSQLNTNTQTLTSEDTAVTLWNLTDGLPYPQRLETIANLYDQMSTSGKEKFFNTCLPVKHGPLHFYNHITDSLDSSVIMSNETYAMLADHPDYYIRELVMTHSETSQEILAAHINDPDVRIRVEIAQRLSLTYTDEISKLAQGESNDIHKTLLERKDLPENIINEIYENTSMYNTIYIARHKNTSQQLLEHIYAENGTAQKTSPWGTDILISLAGNPHTPVPILVELCKHGSNENADGITINYQVSEQAQVTLLRLRKNNIKS